MWNHKFFLTICHHQHKTIIMIPTAQRMHRHVQNSSSFMKFRSAVDDSDDDSDDDTIIVDNKVINDAVSNLNCVDNSVADESKETHNNKNCKNHTQQFKEEDEIVPWSSRKGKSKGWQLLYDLLMDVRSSRQLTTMAIEEIHRSNPNFVCYPINDFKKYYNDMKKLTSKCHLIH